MLYIEEEQEQEQEGEEEVEDDPSAAAAAAAAAVAAAQQWELRTICSSLCRSYMPVLYALPVWTLQGFPPMHGAGGAWCVSEPQLQPAREICRQR